MQTLFLDFEKTTKRCLRIRRPIKHLIIIGFFGSSLSWSPPTGTVAAQQPIVFYYPRLGPTEKKALKCLNVLKNLLDGRRFVEVGVFEKSMDSESVDGKKNLNFRHL